MIKVTNLQEMNRIENGSLQMHIWTIVNKVDRRREKNQKSSSN